jgi:hypothetical protein
MKAQTISFIREMLITEHDKAIKEYTDIRAHLRNKYNNTDLIDRFIYFNKDEDEDEENLLYIAREKCSEAEHALEDFEQHQW